MKKITLFSLLIIASVAMSSFTDNKTAALFHMQQAGDTGGQQGIPPPPPPPPPFTEIGVTL